MIYFRGNDLIRSFCYEADSLNGDIQSLIDT